MIASSASQSVIDGSIPSDALSLPQELECMGHRQGTAPLSHILLDQVQYFSIGDTARIGGLYFYMA